MLKGRVPEGKVPARFLRGSTPDFMFVTLLNDFLGIKLVLVIMRGGPNGTREQKKKVKKPPFCQNWNDFYYLTMIIGTVIQN